MSNLEFDYNEPTEKPAVDPPGLMEGAPDTSAIKTATGKSFRVDTLSTIPYPPQAYIRIVGEDLVNLVKVFSDPVETAWIEYGTHIIEGYTTFGYIMPEGEAIKICLRKE